MNAYEGRINRVIDFVTEHLDERLTLEQLAKVACFSPFHFHRVFAAATGETVHELVQRLRLERAASWLVTRPGRSITEIALDCGFVSSAVFARAFRARFGCTASVWRGSCVDADDAKSKIHQSLRNERKASGSAKPYGGAMDIEIKDMPAWHVAYVRRFGRYGEGVPETWAKLAQWAEPRGLLGPETPRIGVGHDDPHITAPEKCRYDACIPVPADLVPESPIGLADIPGGRAAVFHFDGPQRDIPAAYDAFYGLWLPKSGYQPIDRPSYELFYGSPRVGPDRLRFDICMLVKPLS
jgi:AraC family transcriptional regulator